MFLLEDRLIPEKMDTLAILPQASIQGQQRKGVVMTDTEKRKHHTEYCRAWRKIDASKKRKHHTEYCRLWRLQHPESIKLSAKLSRTKRREINDIENKIWKKTNPDKMREYRKRWAQKNFMKSWAEGYVYRNLTAPNECSRCGIAVKLHAHHSDYNLPLNVVWLCPRCHRREHQINTPKDVPIGEQQNLISQFRKEMRRKHRKE